MILAPFFYAQIERAKRFDAIEFIFHDFS